MKLPIIATRVKDSPTAATARPTAGGARAWCISGSLFTGDSGSATTSLIEVTASAQKTYHVTFCLQYYDNFSAIPAGTDVDVIMGINSDSVSVAGDPDYTFSWFNNDVETGAAGDRANVSISSVQSLDAGDHEFSTTIFDASFGALAFYSLTVIETDYTGDGCFALNSKP